MARGNRGTQGEPTDWVTRAADDAVRHAGEGKPVTCSSGASPSGPVHLGNLREFITVHFVADELQRRGVDARHLHVWDDYDRFRKVPVGVPEEWADHIGRPLTAVPDPWECHPNWAEHFKEPLRRSLAELGIVMEEVSQTELYGKGVYREQVLHAVRNRHQIEDVLARYRTKKPAAATSDQEAEALADSVANDDADPAEGLARFPFKPYCRGCGRDTTTLTSYDDETTDLAYTCTACGGSYVTNLATQDEGKLVWKVDWPMRWAYEGVDFEPSGVDHQSPGSSFVVGGQLVQDIFGGRQPIGPMYAFVGIAGMAKMSSSKGGVPTPADALVLLEPPVLRWLYVRRRPNQSFTVSFDAELLRLYDEWDALGRKVAGEKAQPGDLAAYSRSVRTASRELTLTPKPVPYRALTSIIDITGGHPEQTLRILEGFDLDGPVRSLDDVRPRLDCASQWVRTQLDPSERTRVRREPNRHLLDSLEPERREALGMLAARLDDDWSLDGLTSLTYGIPKLQAGLDIGEKKLPPEVKKAQRDLFKLLYRLLVDSDTGPRLPTLLLCVGPDRVRHLITG